MSKLTKCNALDLSNQFPQAEHWINNFILNSIFRVVPTSDRPCAFGILRRAQMVLVEHELGRIALQDYVKGPRKKVSLYFKALSYFESVVSNLYQAFEFSLLLTKKDKLFESNDGSPIQRLNRINNIIKHLQQSTIPESHLYAVWITNNGLSTRDGAVTFEELADLIQKICTMADKLSSLPSPNE